MYVESNLRNLLSNCINLLDFYGGIFIMLAVTHLPKNRKK